MKIYTKTGDDGTTSLVGGKRISKTSSTIHLIGTLDELNSVIGIARSFYLREKNENLAEYLQKLLFNMGADVASNNEEGLVSEDLKIHETDVINLEGWIDALNEELPELKWFILPTGKQTASVLHHARAICRRAERIFWEEQQWEPALFNPNVGTALNRLSDLLFVMARYENKHSIHPEEKWKV